MALIPGTPDEGLSELRIRRPWGPIELFQRYVMGKATETPLTKAALRKKLNWDDDETDINDRRIRIIRDELVFTMEGLREQFAKVAAIIALFALMIAFSLSGSAKEKTVTVVCLAAMVAVWVQSPRLKIFSFAKRRDSALRIGEVVTQFDEYYYIYLWLNRREQTLQAAEVLVFLVTLVGIAALAYVGFVA